MTKQTVYNVIATFENGAEFRNFEGYVGAEAKNKAVAEMQKRFPDAKVIYIITDWI